MLTFRELLWLSPTLAACSFAAAPAPAPAVPSPAPVTRPPPTSAARVIPSLVFEQPNGAEAARAAAWFAPASPSLRRCVGGAAVIQLAIQGEPGRARYTVQPGTGLDSRQRRCVLEALSTVDPDGVLGTGSPSTRPSGFTGLIRIEW